jgi:hypothetical protein
VSSFPVFTFSGESLEVGGDQPLLVSGQCNEFMGIGHNRNSGDGPPLRRVADEATYLTIRSACPVGVPRIISFAIAGLFQPVFLQFFPEAFAADL